MIIEKTLKRKDIKRGNEHEKNDFFTIITTLLYSDTQ